MIGAVAGHEVGDRIDAGADALIDIVGRLRVDIVGPDEVIAWARINAVGVVAAIDGIVAGPTEQIVGAVAAALPPSIDTAVPR
jgi:hypothetical protein